MRNGLKALGLSLVAAFSMMAFSAVGAQAETLPGLSAVGWFTVGGSKTLAVGATATGTAGAGSLLVAGRNLELKCETGHVSEGVINSGTDASGKVVFLGCLSFALSTGEHLKNCVIPKGEIVAKALILPILHGGNEYVLFEPQVAGGTFATVLYEKELGCVLPHSNPVSGSIVAETNALEGNPLGLTFSPAIQLLSGDVLRFGAFPSYIHSTTVAVEPTGAAHENLNLGVH